MRKPEVSNYKGKDIFNMNFSKLKTITEIVDLIKLSKEYIHNQPAKSLLTYTNLDGIHFNSEIKNIFSDFIASNKPYVKASAVIGISGLVRVVFNGVTKITGRDVRSFESEVSAKNWLVSK